MSEEGEVVTETPEVVPEVPETPAAPAWSDDDASEARLFGWKPSTEWQGEKPAGYIESPVEYMDRVKRSKTFTAMEERLKAHERAREEDARKLAAVNEMALRRQREDFERQLSAITAGQRAAVAAQDTEAFDRLEQRKTQIIQDQQSQPTIPPQPVPEVAQYRAANEWTNNPILWEEAKLAVDLGVKAGIPLHDAQTQIAYADGIMRQKYPHLFQPKESPRQRSVVDGGGLAAAKPATGFNALPAEARNAFARFVKEGLFKDDDAGRREFMRDYGNA